MPFPQVMSNSITVIMFSINLAYRDTQRLSSLNLSLKSYTAIAPPASRFASTKGILSQQINRETTRRQLQTVTERLASEVNAIKVQKQAADIQQEEVGTF